MRIPHLPTSAFPNFDSVQTPDGVKYACLICPNSRPILDRRRHCLRPVHQMNVARVAEAERRRNTVADLDDSAPEVEATFPGAGSDSARLDDADTEALDVRRQDEARNLLRWRQIEADLDRAMVGPRGPPPRPLAEELDDLGPLFNLVASLDGLQPAGGDPSVEDGSGDESDHETEDIDEEDSFSDTGDPGRPTWYPFKSKWVGLLDLVCCWCG
ncbi:hypothetical protein PGTUg99_020795 [Puccinia graminis f. sp. tritici]|uniref:Uncharacterized protein n=1 Tax=Puccinia graminis f. sp. tritici TaxID=56615 RepID=A0A5B0RD96_PUCGR|nr:hypothetical protein PGTUg99_020795 [Puccinia graminis f. sp. tritici]